MIVGDDTDLYAKMKTLNCQHTPQPHNSLYVCLCVRVFVFVRTFTTVARKILFNFFGIR